jgi:sugar phosphate isomerase/epimerase
LFAEDGALVPERVRRAADAGLDGVEFWHWRDKDLEAVGEAARAGGLAIVMMLVEPQVPIVDAGRLAEFAEAAEDSARAAATLGCATLVVAGALPSGRLRKPGQSAVGATSGRDRPWRPRENAQTQQRLASRRIRDVGQVARATARCRVEAEPAARCRRVQRPSGAARQA